MNSAHISKRSNLDVKLRNISSRNLNASEWFQNLEVMFTRYPVLPTKIYQILSHTLVCVVTVSNPQETGNIHLCLIRYQRDSEFQVENMFWAFMIRHKYWLFIFVFLEILKRMWYYQTKMWLPSESVVSLQNALFI